MHLFVIYTGLLGTTLVINCWKWLFCLWYDSVLVWQWSILVNLPLTTMKSRKVLVKCDMQLCWICLSVQTNHLTVNIEMFVWDWWWKIDVREGTLLFSISTLEELYQTVLGMKLWNLKEKILVSPLGSNPSPSACVVEMIAMSYQAYLNERTTVLTVLCF